MKFCLNIRKKKITVRMVKQLAKRGSGFSISGGFQSSTRKCPEQPNTSLKLHVSCANGGTSWPAEVPSHPHCSMMLWVFQKTANTGCFLSGKACHTWYYPLFVFIIQMPNWQGSFIFITYLAVHRFLAITHAGCVHFKTWQLTCLSGTLQILI